MRCAALAIAPGGRDTVRAFTVTVTYRLSELKSNLSDHKPSSLSTSQIPSPIEFNRINNIAHFGQT